MKKAHQASKLVPQGRKRDAGQPQLLVFCEKTTGATQFRAESDGDLHGTLERMAGLLAIQCLVRGWDPHDFDILVAAETAFRNRLVSRAQELLREGTAMAAPLSLSPRQGEILQAVIHNRANKEIASQLNISVRTVKFHISALLSKFGAQNRAELARRAAGFLRPKNLRAGDLFADDFENGIPGENLKPVAVISDHRQASSSRVQ